MRRGPGGALPDAALAACSTTDQTSRASAGPIIAGGRACAAAPAIGGNLPNPTRSSGTMTHA